MLQFCDMNISVYKATEVCETPELIQGQNVGQRT
jgi:hypothetical protein